MIKFYYSKYKYLKHTDFIFFRNFNDFLKFNPGILFLKIKTQPPKEVSWPSQKEFLLCEHLIPTAVSARSISQHSPPPSARIKARVIRIDSLSHSGADQRSH